MKPLLRLHEGLITRVIVKIVEGGPRWQSPNANSLRPEPYSATPARAPFRAVGCIPRLRLKANPCRRVPVAENDPDNLGLACGHLTLSNGGKPGQTGRFLIIPAGDLLGRPHRDLRGCPILCVVCTGWVCTEAQRAHSLVQSHDPFRD